jgi:hypothetical protein
MLKQEDRMTARSWKFAGVAAVALLGVAACKTTQSPAPNSAGEVTAATPAGTTDAGTDAGTGAGTTGGTTSSTTGAAPTGSGGTSVPALVSVNLQNVLNDLSVSLKVNRNNIPVTAQVPVDVAANVCGVSVDVLAASVANGHGTCTAKTASPQLTQLVQQQIASGGSVTGGPQTMGSPSSSTTNNMI